VLEQMPGSVILQPILQTSTEEACEDRLFNFVIDGKLQLKHDLLLNNEINKSKKTENVTTFGNSGMTNIGMIA